MSDFLEKIKYFMLKSTGIKAAAWVGVGNVMIHLCLSGLRTLARWTVARRTDARRTLARATRVRNKQ